MREICFGLYGTLVHLPLSGLSRSWRRLRLQSAARSSDFLQPVRLPTASWRQCTSRRLVPLWEPGKQNGNIRISELAVLNAIAADCENGSTLFEIGTFDGRTTLNLALSAPGGCRIVTLDLPCDRDTALPLEAGERHMVRKQASGSRLEQRRADFPDAVSRITRLLGDSARFDYSPYLGRCSLVFVDGSHSHEYAKTDSSTAMRLVSPGGKVIWHDYGIWPGVTKALEELEEREALGLRNIRGTSLVIWQSPGR